MTQDAAKQVNQTRFPLDRIIDTWTEGFADLDGSVKPDSEEGVAMTKCKEAANDLIIKLIVAKSDTEFQQIYDKGLKDLETMGMAKYVDAVNVEHQKQLKELGK
jgi:putative aldouronate transport system substrate-binding protein